MVRAAEARSPFSSFFAVLDDDEDEGEDGTASAARVQRPPLPELTNARSTPAGLAQSLAEVQAHGREGGPSAGNARMHKASVHLRRAPNHQAMGIKRPAQSLPEPEAVLKARLAARAAGQKPGPQSLDAHVMRAELRQSILHQRSRSDLDVSSEIEAAAAAAAADWPIDDLGRTL